LEGIFLLRTSVRAQIVNIAFATIITKCLLICLDSFRTRHSYNSEYSSEPVRSVSVPDFSKSLPPLAVKSINNDGTFASNRNSKAHRSAQVFGASPLVKERLSNTTSSFFEEPNSSGTVPMLETSRPQSRISYRVPEENEEAVYHDEECKEI